MLEHGGSASREHIRVQQCVRSSGGPECVPASELSDRGDFRCVLLSEEGEVLFARPYNSIFAEWATIEEAQTTERSFLESVLVPEPEGPVRLRVDRRGASGGFEPLYEALLDLSQLAEPEPLEEREVIVLKATGAARERVDLVLAGDGYARQERERFVEGAKASWSNCLLLSPIARAPTTSTPARSSRRARRRASPIPAPARAERPTSARPMARSGSIATCCRSMIAACGACSMVCPATR